MPSFIIDGGVWGERHVPPSLVLGTTMSRQATLTQCVLRAPSLATLDADTAQPLPLVRNRPFLFWKLREMLRFGVEDFVILTGKIPQTIEDAILTAADSLPRRVSLRFAEAAANPAEALQQAATHLHPTFLLADADTLFDANLAALLADFAQDPPETLARLMVRQIPDATGHAAATLDGDRITSFGPPADPAARAHIVGAGIAAIDRRVLDLIAQSPYPTDLYPTVAAGGHLRATLAHGWFADISHTAELAHARRELAACMDRPALILDRDGVLNHDHGYVGTQDRWDWIDGAREAVALATNHGWHVFIASNQSGIARGLFSEAEAGHLMTWIADELRGAGGTLDDYRLCPFHTDAKLDPYRRDSDWRKPAPGMVLDLLKVWELDPRHCLMIGDKDTDIQAANAAGIRSALFPGGNLLEFLKPLLGV